MNFYFTQGSVETFFRQGVKCYFVANLLRTIHSKFYQNQPSLTEDTIKAFWVTFHLEMVVEFSTWLSSGFDLNQQQKS